MDGKAYEEMGERVESFVKSAMEKIEPISENEWRLVKPYIEVVNLGKKQELIRFGDPEFISGLLISGCLQLSSQTAPGKECVNQIITEGHFFGSTGYSDSRTFVTCRSVLCSEVALVKENVFTLSDYMKHLKYVLMEKNISAARAHIAQLLSLSPEERYARFSKEYCVILEHIPNYIIASYLGITPVHLSRIKTKLNRL